VPGGLAVRRVGLLIPALRAAAVHGQVTGPLRVREKLVSDLKDYLEFHPTLLSNPEQTVRKRTGFKSDWCRKWLYDTILLDGTEVDISRIEITV
jgi:hypothetical protein